MSFVVNRFTFLISTLARLYTFGMSSSNEIEIKFRVAELDSLVSRLGQLGLKQVNLLFGYFGLCLSKYEMLFM